ncbi:glycosyl hydrolase family 18 protein [Lacipirellula parvula]|uniref:chitinase n=1 Tax=Lacipirellula parvula TaxID=2650471 RepID=A0A5K7X5T0_9BACT|nr:glycosyl hydrolase family 18 protein [Lacipirellula parvula]BBO31207.1 hypothetical protein PLANPX_0819 [Lacipirellula parvula]
MAVVACTFHAHDAVALDLIGYLPNYRINANYIANTLPGQLAMLDEIRYFGITVNGNGTLTTTAADLSNLQSIKSAIDALPAAQRPRLGITIGGAGTSDGFGPVAASSTLRDQFAINLNALLNQTGASAVDLDWEHPSAGVQRNTQFPAMLTRTKQELGANRRVYATVDPTVMIPASTLTGANAIDGVSLMTYDLSWWAGDPADQNLGQHSLQEYVDASVKAWTDAPGSPNQRPWVFGTWGRGVAAAKLGAGLPFYGRGFNGSSADVAVTYRDLATSGTTTNGSDYVYNGSNVWIPSLDMVEDRVEAAHAAGLQHLIIWELAQDLAPTSANSMLRRAYETNQSLSAVPGDFDGDGAVGQLDLEIWKGAFNASTTAGDANGDERSDGADFLIWQRHATPTAPTTAVPEPTSGLLLAPSLLIYLARRHMLSQ